jgi:hypothetical protein
MYVATQVQSTERSPLKFSISIDLSRYFDGYAKAKEEGG